MRVEGRYSSHCSLYQSIQGLELQTDLSKGVEDSSEDEEGI